MKKIVIIAGTRPEIIKLAPVILELKSSSIFKPVVIATGQHQSMATQAFSDFSIVPDINLELMEHNQSTNELLAKILSALNKELIRINPACVLVQGDTTTTLGASLSAFHLNIPVAHIEAGLRTHDFNSPFPEEMNRVFTSKLSSIHFCPTELAARNLENEGITDDGKVFIVGNTIVDALEIVRKSLETRNKQINPQLKSILANGKKNILITGHRRENFDQPLRNLCLCLKKISNKFSDLNIIYPVHLNPKVQEIVNKELSEQDGIFILPPLDYYSLIYLLQNSSLIITDSGGIQEEAPSFGVKVLITRNITERPEAINQGCSEIISLANPDTLLEKISQEIISPSNIDRNIKNPYGDGMASKRIAKILADYLA